jgi:hypothetical protein
MPPRLHRLARLGALIALIAAFGSWCAEASASTDGPYQDVYWVVACSYYGNTATVFSSSNSPGGFTEPNSCTPGTDWTTALQINTSTPPVGSVGRWSATTPSPDLRIIGAYTPPQYGNPVAACNLGGDGFGAEFFWGDAGVNFGSQPITIDCHGRTAGLQSTGGINQKIQSSRYFGWQVSCNHAVTGGAYSQCTANNSGQIVLEVSGVALEVQKTSGPNLGAVGTNLWNELGSWVRGVWGVGLGASDPSGVCTLAIKINGKVINSYVDWLPDTSNWSQCPGSQIPGSVDTTGYPNGAGAVSVEFSASNAAGAVSDLSRSFNVDNQTPSVSLAGPTDALSTAGPQYVTATATAGPSGTREIDCTVDGGPRQTYAASTARIPVSGLGAHTVSCSAQNNAVNPQGAYASSPVESLTMQIRQPTASAITFSSLVDALRCQHRVVKVPGKVRVVRRHGRRVKIRLHSGKRTVVRCHARTVRRKVRVIVVRHGHKVPVTKIEHVVLLPHVVSRPTLRVAHNATATVSGWLGLADGTALGGRNVHVLTAPDDGLDRFGAAITAQTAANGFWTAVVPAGPSRLVQASYPGDTTTEPTLSQPLTLTVPARVILTSVMPRRVAWGGTVRIGGQLLGGYLPPVGTLLRLRIGIGSAFTTYGVREHVAGRGRFTTTYTFGVGQASQHRRYWFQVATLPVGDYPYAPAASRRVSVTVGGHPRHRWCRRSAKLCM